MNKSLERPKLPKLTQEKMHNLSKFIPIKEMECIFENFLVKNISGPK